MIYFNDLFLIQQFERDIRRYATHERKMMLDNHALYDKTKVGSAVSLRWATVILSPKSGSLNTSCTDSSVQVQLPLPWVPRSRRSQLRAAGKILTGTRLSQGPECTSEALSSTMLS